MAGFVAAIGVISELIGIIQFGADLLPQKEDKATTVRIHVGLNGGNGDTLLENADGQLPWILAYNAFDEESGSNNGGGSRIPKIKSGEFYDTKVSGGQQAVTLRVEGRKDAVCIAYITATWPGGDQFAISGDVFQMCQRSWYYSNVYVGKNMVKCGWLDEDHTNGLETAAFKWKLPDYSDVDESQLKQRLTKEYMCSDKRIKFYEGRWDGKEIGWPKKRDGMPNNSTIPAGGDGTSLIPYKKLVISQKKDTKASVLCESQTAFGPSMASVPEGLFCDMATKTLYNICDDAVDDNQGVAGIPKEKCFDIPKKALRTAGKLGKRENPTSHYSDVMQW